MTLGELFSSQVSDFITEVNKNHPDISSAEFCKMVEEFVENNKASIIEEAIDFDDELEDETKPVKKEDEMESEEGGEGTEGDKTEPEGGEEGSTEHEDGEKSGETKSKVAKVKVTKDRKATFDPIDYSGSRKGKEEVTIRKKRTDVDPEDDRYIIHDGVRKRILRNSERDKMSDIHYVVDRWYKEAEKTGKNLEKHTALEFFVTSEVTDMSALFAFANVPNIDLSSWDTSNVTNMEGMFYRSTFNNHSIEEWDVGSCINFRNMFVGCRFSGDISSWIPGTYEEIEYDDDGRVIKEEDDDGVLREKHKKVRARLPEVGARLIDIATEEDNDIDDMIKGLGTKVEESKRHVLTMDEFVNEGLYDNIKKRVKQGVEYIKDKLKSLAVKFNDFFVLNINPMTMMPVLATDPDTTINYITTAKPNGVTAFTSVKSPLLVDGVQETATINESDERYGRVEKGSIEEKNYVEFMKMLAENGDNTVTEARVGLDAKSGGLRITDITTPQLEKMIDRVMKNVPGVTGKKDSRALCIYGAPGIGKTSIPKSIIKKWNEENPDKKKAIIVIECGDLELGGFNIPIPKGADVAETVYANTAVRKKLIDMGYTEEDFDNLKDKKVLKTFEAPKTWLPVYYTGGTPEEIAVQRAIANGRKISKMVYNEKAGEFDEIEEETTEGGIIMFDEFLRAEPELFKTICQLVMNRTIGNGEYRLGSKWGIILCSNRPVDDDEVAERYEKLPPAMANRFLEGMYNFIPDFNEWLDWARTDGHFDEYTLKFLSRDANDNKDEYVDGRGNIVTAYKNWHNIDVDKFKSGEEPIPTTPRGWAALMDWVDDEKRIMGVDSIFDIDMADLKEKACAVIGQHMGEMYCEFMMKEKNDYEKGLKPKTVKFFEGDLKEDVDIDTYKCGEAVKDIEGYIESHFRRREVLSDPTIGDKFLSMAKNMDKLYSKEIMSTDLKVLHNHIVRKVYKIRSKDKDSKPLLMALRPYLEYVSDKYDVELLPPVEV